MKKIILSIFIFSSICAISIGGYIIFKTQKLTNSDKSLMTEEERLKAKSYIDKNNQGAIIKVQGMIKKQPSNTIDVDYFDGTVGIALGKNVIYYLIDIPEQNKPNVTSLIKEPSEYLKIGKFVTIFCKKTPGKTNFPEAETVVIWNE